MACGDLSEFLAAISKLPAGDPTTWKFETQNKELILTLHPKDKAPEYWLSACKSDDGLNCVVAVMKKLASETGSPESVHDLNTPQPVALSKARFNIRGNSFRPSPTDLQRALQESFKNGGEWVHLLMGPDRQTHQPFVSSIPPSYASAHEVRQWLQMWFEERAIPVTPFRKAIDRVHWDGYAIRDNFRIDLQDKMRVLGFEYYASDISHDISRARGDKSWNRIGFEIVGGLFIFCLVLRWLFFSS